MWQTLGGYMENDDVFSDMELRLTWHTLELKWNIRLGFFFSFFFFFGGDIRLGFTWKIWWLGIVGHRAEHRPSQPNPTHPTLRSWAGWMNTWVEFRSNIWVCLRLVLGPTRPDRSFFFFFNLFRNFQRQMFFFFFVLLLLKL